MMMLQNLSKPFFVLAPMDDVTDVVFRQIVAECAKPDLFITEFVNVDGLASAGREKLLPKLKKANTDQPIFAQLWGNKPENYYQATKDVMAMGYDGVDINMGCPDKTVVKNGSCSALINNRELAQQIIEQVREAAGDDFPISVKTRLGFNDIDLSWHEFLLSHKLNMLTIHGRTRKEMSKEPANWDKIAEVRALRDRISPTTLIVGNGDVLSKQQGYELAAKHQLDGIMIGRGIFHDPFVFAEHDMWADTAPIDRMKLYKKHVQLFMDTWQHGERKVHTLNKFCRVYVNGFDGASQLRERLMNAHEPDELLRILDESLAELA
jgi:tRNA-dihydrouridine synthase